MNRDANGLSLSIGDTVLVPFKIESLSETPDFGNVSLRSVLGRSPDHAKEFLHLNRKQVIRANPEDEVSVSVKDSGETEYTLRGSLPPAAAITGSGDAAGDSPAGDAPQAEGAKTN